MLHQYYHSRDAPDWCAVIENELNKYGNVRNLMRYITADALIQQHYKQLKKKASGIDGVTKNTYDCYLKENIISLLERMRDLSYSPLPVKRRYIPKANGKLRPLGIPSYEDRLVQGVMADILNIIYEQIFLDCSFGFRPNRNCHIALKKLHDVIDSNSIHYIVETDIKGFFDNVNHELLVKFLRQIIKDKTFIYYIHKFLKAGVIEDGKKLKTKLGTPQGGLISPVLANVYLHYTLDEWFETDIKRKCMNCHLIRYCDDFVVGFQNKDDANWFYNEVNLRFQKYKLELEPTKTRIINLESNTSFNFLGYNIFINKDRNNQYSVDFTVSSKKLNSKKEDIKHFILQNRNDNIDELIKSINLKLEGFYNYFNTESNSQYLEEYYIYTLLQLSNVLNKKQKNRLKTKLEERPLLKPPNCKFLKI